IGSGLGGLTAAALVADAGHRVLVLERQSTFGGAASTYHRGPLTIEASLHETTPPDSPGDPKRELFDLLGLSDQLRFVEAPTFQEVRWKGLGEPFRLPHGLEAVQAALDARFPAMHEQSAALLEQIRRILRVPEFGSPDHDIWWRLLHAAELPQDIWAAMRHIRSSLADVFSAYFGDHEAIKLALCANLSYYSDDPKQFWWLAFAMAQGSYIKSGGFYIHGGSQQLTNSLLSVIRDRDGVMLAESSATAIVLDESGAISGVRYRDQKGGAEKLVKCHTVFANAAPHVVQTFLPEEKRAEFMTPYADRPLSISLLSATLGLDQSAANFGVSSYSTVLVPDWLERFNDFPETTTLFGADPGARMPVSCVVDYTQIDSGIADGPLYPLNIVCPDRLSNWADLDETDYQARRAAWLDALIGQLDREWPGLAHAVQAKTLSTAREMHHHLNTPEGAIYGFAMTPPKQFPPKPPRRTITPIPGLWISSAYTGFGGFTGAIGGGITAAKTALREGIA
ncbi:MAG: NAD(P)/FAD-dependent oxidoreductase, partial [Gammaproteobacteria bacterium]|nr:NAD(P)/FAD-dependent oxidoreductase [Gammaproteobacteria bacterium]